MGHEDEILGNRIERTEKNTVAVIQNQLALRDLIKSGAVPAAPVSSPNPNMIHIEMEVSIGELVMKAFGLFVAVLVLGLLIGFRFGKRWNVKKDAYNPVKFVDEAGNETEREEAGLISA